MTDNAEVQQLVSAEQMEARVRAYMDACTSGVAESITAHMTPDAVHYFPPGTYGGPWRGADVIASNWVAAVRLWRSSWTVDRIAVDPARGEAVCEWTHFKSNIGVILRGTEWYEFTDGLISEIRAYYATPQSDSLTTHELSGFDYDVRGYPMRPPEASAAPSQEGVGDDVRP